MVIVQTLIYTKRNVSWKACAQALEMETKECVKGLPGAMVGGEAGLCL